MDSSNSFAALATKAPKTKTTKTTKPDDKGKDEAEAPIAVAAATPIAKAREIHRVKVPADVPVFKLFLGQLGSAVIDAYSSFTKETAFGESFWDETAGIQELLGELASLFAHYKSDEVEHIWKRYVKTFRIAGADLPVHSADEDQECANIETMVRCLIAQLRTIDEKNLIVGQGRAGIELCDMQADFSALVGLLGEAHVKRDIMTRNVEDGEGEGETKTKTATAEALVWQLRDAFKTAKAAKDAAWKVKSAAIEASKKNRDQRIKEREAAQAPKWHHKHGGKGKQ